MAFHNKCTIVAVAAILRISYALSQVTHSEAVPVAAVNAALVIDDACSEAGENSSCVLSEVQLRGEKVSARKEMSQRQQEWLQMRQRLDPPATRFKDYRPALLAHLVDPDTSEKEHLGDISLAQTVEIQYKVMEPIEDKERASYTNPILRGSYPDPSIVRVGDDFYMASSSFEYFPGIPIHHSKDLVNWDLIGYALHREEQVSGDVNLVDVQSDGGIQAPTIRHHNGVFYIVVTTVYQPPNSGMGRCINFIVAASDPRGPWSMPHVLEDADGIDPSIFFDDDGTAWYTGTHAPADPHFRGEGEIWLRQLDLDNWKLVGKRHNLWRGACGGVWAEGPHIHKYDGKYYLVVAEGGTGLHHAVTVSMSDKIHGPYESNPRNPILTTRHLSYNNWVHSTGHADLVQLPDGRWYMVTLGVRGDLKRSSNMGRESFLVPMIWEREPNEYNGISWPVVAPETGRVERMGALPLGGRVPGQKQKFSDDFNDATSLNLEWNFRRLPAKGTYSLSDHKGYLRLYARPEEIWSASQPTDRTRCSLVGIRQWESDFTYRANMLFSPTSDGVEAGLILYQKDNLYLKYTVSNDHGSHILRLTWVDRGGEPHTFANKKLENYNGQIILAVQSYDSRYHFFYKMGDADHNFLVDTTSDLILYNGYTGGYLGLYASSQGKSTNDYADFDWVEHFASPRD